MQKLFRLRKYEDTLCTRASSEAVDVSTPLFTSHFNEEPTMSKRRTIIIDGGSIIADPGISIGDALERAGITNLPPSVVTGGEIITPDDFNRPAPPSGMLTNLTPISKGAALRDRLLDQECDLIATRFLAQFDGRTRSLELDDNALLIRAFPLPDDISPDYINLLFVICGYPDVPPAGAFFPSNTPNREQLAKRLGGHVQANSTHVINHTPAGYRKYVEELSKRDWEWWICYRYEGWSWKLNPNNLLSGDCLYKFVENTFAALSGGHRD